MRRRLLHACCDTSDADIAARDGCGGVQELEAVDMERPASALEEVGSMQVSFLRMCQNMKEYRNYLPASILAMMSQGGADDGDGAADVEGDSVVSFDASGRSQSSASKLSRSEVGRRSVRNSGDSYVTPPVVDGVFRRNITVLVVNVRGFNKMVEVDASESLSMHTRLIQAIVRGVTKNRGTPDVFLGDRFLATWNTVTRMSTHRTNACHAIHYINTTELPTVMVDNSKNKFDVALTFGVASSEARCGNMGCDGMKKYT
eukprot:PhM_4_TR13895/c0_g1_i7/m.5489